MATHLDHAATPSAVEASPLARPQDALLCDMELPLRRRFYPLGYSVDFVTNYASVLAAAEESFGHADFSREATALQIRIGVTCRAGAICPPEPTRREFNHLYTLVADAENQAVLDLSTGVNFTWLTQAAAENHLYLRYNFVEKIVYLLLGAKVVTDIHAASISKNGKGLLLCGDSGAGKSTLAYACARAGWIYTSDDTSYLINNSEFPRVIGHCHRARFRPSARDLFPELRNCALTPRMEGKPSIEIPASELPIKRTATEAIISAVVYLKRSPEARGRLVRLSDGIATRQFRRELFSAGEIRAKHENILKVLCKTPTYELHYHDLDDGIQALNRLVLEI